MIISKFMAPEIIFGEGALDQIGESFLRLGANKVLVVSDPGVCDAGWVEQALTHLKSVDLPYATFFNVTMNPKDDEVHEGAKVYQEEECDAVLGIGGGSSLDVAKAIAIIVSNGGSIHQYEGVDHIRRPLPPIIAVSTTAGSGSEVSQFSVIVNAKDGNKMTIVSKSLIPDIAIIDPETLMTKDPALTASTGLDVLTHAIEAYVSIVATPLTDVQATNAIRLVASNLRPSVASQTNKEAKNNMAMASLQAGLAFSNAILGAVHAMSHAIGGRYSLSHGEVNAILLPYVMEYNLMARPDRFQDIATFMGKDIRNMTQIEAAKASVSLVRELIEDIQAPKKLSEIGFQDKDLTFMSEIALQDACMITNPRDLTVEEVKSLYMRAL
ncbi:iron-containing alcohol dehydrogenase [Aliibacillus thermotolerans]|uniref:iron-containing alcohol dehydrogenase n=1 Tax=Aliibacillus thermotolerans TaxID=1834418 RepID=UPI0022EA9B17|nr:iron-containing alcohol dehydrogenase [Aliibacillus thermotolerans]MDA3129974.1 iron-containing alcohol dehydrogenase [Aliibacillus thermotolerans]